MSDKSIKTYWRNYIGGKWADGKNGRRIVVENPASGEYLAEIARAEVEDVDRSVEAARKAFRSHVLRDMKPVDRSALMFRIAHELELLVEDVALTECLDTGKRISDTRKEAFASARYFSYYGGLTDKLEGRSIPLGGGYVDYTIPEPYGVSVQIVPWNYPLQLAVRSVSCALATGNSVVVKSPELSPLSVCFLGEACEKAGVPEGVLNILCGYGDETGAALVGHHDIDHIVFTGSVSTGQSILRAASQRIIPCVMELGGKSAGIVYPDVDLKSVAADVISSIFIINAGQICSALSRLIIHSSIHDKLVERLVKKTESLTIGPGIEDHDITPLISLNQLEKVEAYCRGAEEQGAFRVTGGMRVVGMKGFFFPPTIYTEILPEMTIAQEEVFGPVLTVLKFDEPEEAISLANNTKYGLVAGVYTNDLTLAHWTAERLEAGQVFVNEWFAGGVETPFGGTKRSGYGREKGQEALLNYVQTKNIAIRLSSFPNSFLTKIE
jgi:aldehyde dehydrogenase (NAD+)/betaine-aldehyde dehydrogenase